MVGGIKTGSDAAMSSAQLSLVGGLVRTGSVGSLVSQGGGSGSKLSKVAVEFTEKVESKRFSV